jgi:subtilisin family serine protease
MWLVTAAGRAVKGRLHRRQSSFKYIMLWAGPIRLEARAVGIRTIQQRMAIIGALILALCLLALLSAAGPAQADPLPEDLVPGEDFVDGEVVVKLNPESDATIDDINATYKTTVEARLAKLPGVYLLEIPETTDPLGELLPAMEADTRLAYAEPNFIIRTAETDDHRGDGRFKARPDDVSPSSAPSSEQYAARALGLPDAHKVSLGRGVKVAVLDTGIQRSHPALKDNLRTDRKRSIRGYDFIDNDRSPSDSATGLDEDGDGLSDEMVGHGTHVAGIVDLTAPGAKILPLKVLNSEGSGEAFQLGRAILYARAAGAHVINLSLGSPHPSKLVRETVKKALKRNIVVAAAAGNDGNTLLHYPAARDDGVAVSDGLLAVAAVDQNEQKADFSNYGTWVDLAAPGVEIRSTYPVGQHAYWSGTSMATPFVAGQAALVRKASGVGNAIAIEEAMRTSARDLKTQDPLFGQFLGAGHADVCASISDDCSQEP